MTEAQKRFCDEYLISLNATKAYKAAYPSCNKDETANVNGCKLLRNAKVQKYLETKQKELQEKTGVTQKRIIEELAAIAFADATDYAKIKNIKKTVPVYKDDEIIGTREIEEIGVEFTQTDELTKEQKKAIAYIKKGKFGTQVDLYDKTKALELLGKHLGIFKENINLGQDKPFEVNITVKK